MNNQVEKKKIIMIGQSGGPTAVINASLAGAYQMAKQMGASKIYGMRYGIQGLLEKKYVDLSEVLKTDLEVELLKRTPSSYLGSCRYKLPDSDQRPEIYQKLFGILEELEVDIFLYIGGNDSMDTIQKLSDYGNRLESSIRFVGIPKTIDNDLTATDHTPGFGSAAKFIATALKELVRDGLVYDMESVTVVEIMGRNAGWLAGSAALARGEDSEGVDLIYLPEVSFNVDTFLEQVQKLQQKKKSLVVAVSEGIHTENGTYVCELSRKLEGEDAFGHRILTGTASYLAAQITERLGCKARAVELNTLQRCAAFTASATDVEEACLVGAFGVRAAIEGKTGVMITLERVSDQPYRCIAGVHDIHRIANAEKKVPRTWITEEGNNVTEEFLAYIRPLIQGEVMPIMVDGLPGHIPTIK